jgi:hypothetical protein
VNESPKQLNAKVQALIDQGVTKANVMGGYGKAINPYGLTPEQQAAFFAAAPRGGMRSTAGTRRAGTRRAGTRSRSKAVKARRTTARKSKDPLKRYAKHFSSLWKVFAKGKM